MENRLFELRAENFRSLRKVVIPLGPLNVMVGANGAGKSNVLDVVRFLADVIRTDLQPALDTRGGYDRLAFRGGDHLPTTMQIGVKASWTEYSDADTPDQYTLTLEQQPGRQTERKETFVFTRAARQGRLISVSGEAASLFGVNAGVDLYDAGSIGLQRFSSALSTLPRLADPQLADEQGVREPNLVSDGLASPRVFEVDVAAAREPSRVSQRKHMVLDDDAANLAGFLVELQERIGDDWESLQTDARAVLPQLNRIAFSHVRGPSSSVGVILHERGLREPTEVADASYGTIRLLALLALIYDPNPPTLTCIEEIDHGLHPQALELLVERLREASERTQFLIATHSPALADRLRPEELIVCERALDGSSLIPALSQADIADIVEASEGMPLGELWFSGALGGDL